MADAACECFRKFTRKQKQLPIFVNQNTLTTRETEPNRSHSMKGMGYELFQEPNSCFLDRIDSCKQISKGARMYLKPPPISRIVGGIQV